VVSGVAELELLSAAVATKPAQLGVLKVALVIVRRLIEGHERHEIAGGLAAEAARLGEALGHGGKYADLLDCIRPA
jgi:hypothetical protein